MTALSLKHASVSAKPASNDAAKVDGPKWNAEHTITQTMAGIVGGSAAGASDVLTPAQATILLGVDGALSNTRLSKTVAYTAANADKGKTIALAGAAFYALTLGLASGYDANYSVRIVNEDALRCKDVILGAQAITGATNDGTGKVRLSMTSTAAFATGQRVGVSGVVGPTEANGYFKVTVVDATHLDLIDPRYVSTSGIAGPTWGGISYVSGGIIGPAFRLYAKQSTTVFAQNNVWQADYVPIYMPPTALTYYANLSSGNEFNTDGLATGSGAFKSAQRGADAVCDDLWINGVQVSVQLLSGDSHNTLVSGAVLRLHNYLASNIIQTQNNPRIIGDTAASGNYIIDGGAGNGIETVQCLTPWMYTGVTVQASAGGSGVLVDAGSRLYAGAVKYGPAGTKINLAYQAWHENLADVTDAGNATTGIVCAANSSWLIQSGKTWTFSGTPNYSSAFMSLAGGSSATANGTTFSGALVVGVANVVREASSVLNALSLTPATFFSASEVVTAVPIKDGGTGAVTAALARSGLGITGRALHGDGAYTILASDLPLIQTSAALTAPRTWQLPLANSVEAGARLIILDAGGITGSNVLTVTRQGADTFIGLGVAANSYVLANQYSGLEAVSDGVSTWQLARLLVSSPQLSSIELGHASDTTLTRVSAGVMAVEGVSVLASNAANIQAFLTTPSSANLAAAMTDETGTGPNVFGTNPTLTGATLATNLIKGIYVIDASAVESAVHTGDTTETTLATISVPANAMGANGILRVTVQWRFTGANNNRTARVKFNGTEFTNLSTASTSLSMRTQTQIANRNATNSQVGNAIGQANWTGTSTDVITSAHDTTGALNITITGQLTNGGDSIAVESYLVELIRPS